MRRTVITLALLLTACGGDPPVETAAPDAPSRGGVRPEARIDDWIGAHVAPGWFRAAPPREETEREAPAPVVADGAEPVQLPAGAEEPEENPRFGGLSSDGPPPPRASQGVPGEEVNLDPTGEAFDDVVQEESARFGAATEGVSPFGGVEEQSDEASASTAWRRSAQREGACRLSVGDDDLLPLAAYQASVRIDGFRARVVLDLIFTNPHDDVLEGRFKLRLPDGAAVHYLAFGEVEAQAPLILPVNASAPFDLSPASLRGGRGSEESYREARMVPRERAQRAYASETAAAIDPALLEWSGSGVFDTRVFPLLPKARSRVTVGYDLDVARIDGALEFTLNVPDNAATSRVNVQASGRPQDRRVTVSSDVPVQESELFTTVEFDDVSGKTVAVRIDVADDTFLAGEDPATGPLFATRIDADLPPISSTMHDRAVFVVDTSMSMDAERMLTWTRLMERILHRNRAHLREFAVLFFNVETWWWRREFVSNDQATVAQLMDDVSRLALEGATDLGAALREASAPHWSRQVIVADTMLFSDGAETWGVEVARDAASDLPGPLYCYTSRFAGSDTRSLAALARASHGAVFSVRGDTETDLDAAAVAYTRRPAVLRDVHVPGCTDVIVEGNPSSIYPGQTLRISGRGMPATGDRVVLALQQGDNSFTREIPLGRRVESPLVARVYGQIACGTLEALEPVASDDARAYALHFGVTGSTCSLLMLEDDEAYARYEIEPADEATRVRERTLDTVLTERAAESEQVRDDARNAFVAWLDRIERTSGVTFEDLDVVRAAARSLEPSAFDVPVPPLLCRTRVWDDLSSDFRARLGVDEMTYDAAHTEALGRLSVRGADDAIRALSSLVEADPGSTDLLRDVAFSMMEWDEHGQAVGLLRRVIRARPHEPETYRALAECLVETGKVDAAVLVYELALRGGWDGRFGAFGLVTALDYMRLLRAVERGDVRTSLSDLTDAARERLATRYLSDLPDLAVSLTWNTDRTDVDLHIVDPAGFECCYRSPRTSSGGGITQDVTEGYGPELFIVGEAQPGEYVIKANYFGSDALRTTLRTRGYITIARHLGTPEESVTRSAFLLADRAREVDEEGEAMIEIDRIAWE